MPPLVLNTPLLEALLSRVPEGFIHTSTLLQRFRGLQRRQLEHLASDAIGFDGEYFYLKTRATPEVIAATKSWARPQLPNMRHDGIVTGETMMDLEAARKALKPKRLTKIEKLVLDSLNSNPPYLDLSELAVKHDSLDRLFEAGFLRNSEDFYYDPLKYSEASVLEAARRRRISRVSDEVTARLQERPGWAAPQQEVINLVGDDGLKELLSFGAVSRFSVPLKVPPYSETWVRLKSGDFQEAQSAALAATQTSDEAWKEFLPHVGDVLRDPQKSGETARGQVVARTYTVAGAAKRLMLRPETITRALNEGLLTPFTDPENTQRIAVFEIESIANTESRYAALADYETVRVRDIALVQGISFPRVLRRLRKAGLRQPHVPWGAIKGRWELPEAYKEFRQLLRGKLDEARRAKEALRQQEAAQLEIDRQRRRELRERLVAAFPTWQHEGRGEQQIILHVGPPNSGKTHDALQTLAASTIGWYLAPLRLLAFEVFERLNRMGVRCNLLTGEERVDVEGAGITAATIEMFNPMRSGDCVIIDEAQMLADPDRGWAWTRALMEAQSPIIHVIAPPTARSLIEQMAASAAIPLVVHKHERLAPIGVIEQPWNLRNLPERTILVAFSRQNVLELKTTLENWQRQVSVVYGSLPPEVRRKQADRFADGQTELCIATDAVGMGLNLPADNVCFYEVRKFDGRNVRLLSASEVQQIGGRAGRFGLSQAGAVGALRREDLNQVRRLFYAAPSVLTHARVAPTVADLEMIPGTLSEKLSEWAALKSIPESLRGALEVAELAERVELAKMLTRRDESVLGLAASYQLVNAPTRQNSRDYWKECARAIIERRPLPIPPVSSTHVTDSIDLDRLEMYISYADIYLWLSQRREFEDYAPDAYDVRFQRTEWSEAIDRALLRRLKTRKRRRENA